MATTATIIYDLKQQAKGYWAERILAECSYALKLSLVKKGKYDELIYEAACALQAAFRKNGALTKADCTRTEQTLAPLAEDAKYYGVSLIGHAHIDMNWMWSYSETVAITLETFRTILKLLKEYPQFTFGQSQASVYRIVELHEPEMLPEIRKYIRQGRWEVTASQWVEADKNCSNGEAQVRHLLYTKQYLSKLLGINPDSLNLDFEPDTFGHNANVPEILNQAGVTYYYHCRAQETNHIAYRWRAPSGAEVLVNREAFWYNGTVDADYALPVCEMCEKLGITDVLRVYGVGDHGGGPTRRDIERIIEYGKWPIFPRFHFGTYAQHYARLEQIRDTLPVFDKEVNSIFTGCYTTQTRIKLANKLGEARLTDTDAYGAMAEVLCGDFKAQSMFKPWEHILFNQFHDILPGSGVIDTREYAMGIFHQSLAVSNTQSARAMRAIAQGIDTSGLPAEDEMGSVGISEGAGVGFTIEAYGLPKTERGRGKTRILHFFNPSGVDFHGVTRFTIWDWPGDLARFTLKDSSGAMCVHQLLRGGEREKRNYWGHDYYDFLGEVTVPAFGYATYTVSEREIESVAGYSAPWENNEKPYRYVLENENLCAEFDTKTLRLAQLTDKANGKKYIGGEGAGLVKVTEDNVGMTAWRIGRHTRVESLQEQVRVKWTEFGPLRNSICYSAKFGNGSSYECIVSLDGTAKQLDYQLKCDWLETGSSEFIPQLAFHAPLAFEAKQGKYSIPMGIYAREEIDLDVGTNGLAAAPNEDDKALYVTAEGKYGFRLWNNCLGLTILHSSVNPDPYPELGEHNVRFALGISESSNEALVAVQQQCEHPLSYLSGTVHTGSLPLNGNAVTVLGDTVAVSSVKPAEDGNGLIIRLYETAGRDCAVTIRAFSPITAACLTDIPEKTGQAIPVKEGAATLTVKPFSLTNIRVTL